LRYLEANRGRCDYGDASVYLYEVDDRAGRQRVHRCLQVLLKRGDIRYVSEGQYEIK
jgi:hypothetical protein